MRARLKGPWKVSGHWRRQLTGVLRGHPIAPAVLSTTASVRALIRRLGLAVTLITVALPPVGYGALELRDLQKRAGQQASLAARHVEIQLARQPSRDWLSQISTDVLQAVRKADNAVVASWLTDKVRHRLDVRRRKARAMA